MSFFSSIKIEKHAKNYQVRLYEEDYSRYILAKEFLASKNKIEDLSSISEESFFHQLFNHVLVDEEYLNFKKKKEVKKTRQKIKV